MGHPPWWPKAAKGPDGSGEGPASAPQQDQVRHHPSPPPAAPPPLQPAGQRCEPVLVSSRSSPACSAASPDPGWPSPLTRGRGPRGQIIIGRGRTGIGIHADKYDIGREAQDAWD